MLKLVNLRNQFIGPVNLSIERGECLALMGPSGAGKSLLFRAIVDLDPNTGEVFLNNKSRNDIQAHDWRKHVALVPAESGWWGDHVRDHLETSDYVQTLLQAVGLEKALDWEVSRLSTGERHRLAIVRALANRPDVILLDEPTATLDDEATGRVEKLMRDLIDDGIAIFIVTHDQQQADRLSSRQILIKKGQLETVADTEK